MYYIFINYYMRKGTDVREDDGRVWRMVLPGRYGSYELWFSNTIHIGYRIVTRTLAIAHPWARASSIRRPGGLSLDILVLYKKNLQFFTNIPLGDSKDA